MILGRLGHCFQLTGQFDRATALVRDALDGLGRLAPSDAVKGLRGTLRSELGDALRALGRLDEARKAYEAALKIEQELLDFRGQGVDLGRLGTLALAEGKRDEAERYCREAVRIGRQTGNPIQVQRSASNLARVLLNQPALLIEARQLAEEALAIAQSREPGGPEVWSGYGLLADIAEKEASVAADEESRVALQVRARNYRELEQRAPVLLATLAKLGEAPSHGRAVILGQVGRCFRMGGRPDLSVMPLGEALRVAANLAPGESNVVQGLRGTLFFDLAETLTAIGRDKDARVAYEAALKIAEQRQDLHGQAVLSHRLGRIFQEPERQQDAAALEVTLDDELITDYVFDTDLLIDGRRERRISRLHEPDPLDDQVRPMLIPCARSYVDNQGAVRFSLPAGEPILERHPGCVVMRRARRDVAISGDAGVPWRVIRLMDGIRTVAEIMSELPTHEQVPAARVLAALAAAGVVDVSGRPIARFLHSATKKGVLPGGGLESDDVLRLATDGGYRVYQETPQIALGQSVPGPLRAFHSLTRSRRSRRDFLGAALSRDVFDALLYTACGVTGTTAWAGRELKLRAYPSSGALYAVEIYPIVFRVEGLDAAVYHYRAIDHVLEVVQPNIDRTRIVSAALPVEREMVAGAAVMFCLAGNFARHEQKYGEGGYRMLVAEAGHISQNLTLAATALGLSARPFGGVFDDLLSDDLGLNKAEEQFLLSVLVGHTAGR